MAETTHIEWTDHTFNPWIGCTKISPGCAHCYAETLDRHRLSKTLGGATKEAPVSHWGPGAPRYRTHSDNWSQPLAWDRKAANKGTRARVFCASLADWLDDEVPIEWLADLLDLIRRTPNLDWQLLTKRPENWRKRLEAICEIDGDNLAWSWLNGHIPFSVWIGTTVEDQQRADERIPHLLRIPAKVRFLSCEPLLESVDLRYPAFNGADSYGQIEGIHWVICGGESGPGARPMEAAWARSMRDQCAAVGVPFFFKQWGGRTPKAGGRLLDGVEHNEFPTSEVRS